MTVHALRSVCIGALAAGIIATACGSNNSPGAGDSGTGGGAGSGGATATGGSGGSGGATATGGSGGSGGTTATGGSGGTTAGDGSTPISDGGGGDSGLVACPAGLEDKITTCTTGTTPACSKACGPNLPAGSSQPELGTKSCTCPSGVYTCADCVYEAPPPACYTVTGTAPVCPAGAGNGLPCTDQCVDGTPGPCTISVDAGAGVMAKTDGCVCIMGTTSLTWACATEWWM
jgi:hypothetical protein